MLPNSRQLSGPQCPIGWQVNVSINQEAVMEIRISPQNMPLWQKNICVLKAFELLKSLPMSRTCRKNSTVTNLGATMIFNSWREVSTTPTSCHQLSYLPATTPKGPYINLSSHLLFQKHPLSFPFPSKIRSTDPKFSPLLPVTHHWVYPLCPHTEH